MDRGLRARGDLELAEDVRDVVLDRLLAELELVGDLTIRQAERDEADDLDLTLRQSRILADRSLRIYAFEQRAREPRIDGDLACDDGPGRAVELFERALFQEKAARAEAQ